MSSESAATIAVVDFRRHSMILQWHSLGGTWTAYDNPPRLVHGVALIRPSQPNICVYGQAGRLRLQVGPDQYALGENSPRIRCVRAVGGLGFRRRFSVESSNGVLFNCSYWMTRGADFFRWLAAKAEDPDWRIASARLWSDGVTPAAMRAE